MDRAVTLDAHGVLLLPDVEAIRVSLMPFDCQPDEKICWEAHYRMMRLLDLTLAPDWPTMNRSFAAALGVAAQFQDEAGTLLAKEVYLGTAWVPAPFASRSLSRLIESGVGVAVVTNSFHGEMAEFLARTKVCSVGGEFNPVAAIIDSKIIGIEKPDPRPFELALSALNVTASECIHVGDSVHSDVVGAARAGVAAVHVDPLKLCNGGDHRHVSSFADFVAGFLG